METEHIEKGLKNIMELILKYKDEISSVLFVAKAKDGLIQVVAGHYVDSLGLCEYIKMQTSVNMQSELLQKMIEGNK